MLPRVYDPLRQRKMQTGDEFNLKWDQSAFRLVPRRSERNWKKNNRNGINKNRDPATAQVSVEMKIKQQKAFCGRNKLKSMSRFCERLKWFLLVYLDYYSCGYLISNTIVILVEYFFSALHNTLISSSILKYCIFFASALKIPRFWIFEITFLNSNQQN